jgi:hypothetical protein
MRFQFKRSTSGSAPTTPLGRRTSGPLDKIARSPSPALQPIVWSDVVPLLVKKPELLIVDLIVCDTELLERCFIEYEYTIDMMLLFEVRNQLESSVKKLVRAEINRLHNHESSNELLRGNTGAAKAVSAMLAFDTIDAFRTECASMAAGFIMGRLSWSPSVLVAVTKDFLEHLHHVVLRMPSELLLVMHWLIDLESECNSHDLAMHVFLLRFVGPTLAQPLAVSGLDVPEQISQKMLQVAKCAQLIAMQGTIAEDNFVFPAAKKLLKLKPLLDKIGNAIAKRSGACISERLVNESLHDAARHVCQFVGGLPIANESTQRMREELRALKVFDNPPDEIAPAVLVSGANR